ncbi:transmembrane protein 241 isoform X4 [Nothoprocta perdicaria]|uniref:transmembrane protein 241 isoform X4 n=1 Tax=Nothoprocta perdicaria TaxID=30464 RepID=UPI000E1BB45A|nr:transmembrane protein 241 isoform X4 [Nothoprocta perdicaria]
MFLKRPAGGLAFCLFYVASCFTNKYVLSVLKFTYPTLFQGWQTLVGGLLLHASWKLGWVEISLASRSDILSWLPASALFVGIIYAGSRALSRLPIPVFLTVHNAAEVITCGFQKFVQKEQTSLLKVCSALCLLGAAVCLPLCDTQFDPNGYLWAFIHLICLGAYKVFHKLWKPCSLSDLDQQYINYVFSVVLLASASHPAELLGPSTWKSKYSRALPGCGRMFFTFATSATCQSSNPRRGSSHHMFVFPGASVISSVPWTSHSSTSTDSIAAAVPVDCWDSF